MTKDQVPAPRPTELEILEHNYEVMKQELIDLKKMIVELKTRLLITEQK